MAKGQGIPGNAAKSVPANAGLEFLRARSKAKEDAGGSEIQRKIGEEKLERRILEKVETVITRQLSMDSLPMRKLSERIYSGLSEGLVLEKERLGWR